MPIPTPHISAKLGDFAPTVLMPGDPLRAKFIAETYLTDAKLVNNVRGVQGYTGLYNGKRITDVNKRYAASSTWDEKVCRNMVRYYSIISKYHNEQLEKLK